MDETTSSGATSAQDTGAGLLGALLSNPEWMGRVQGILSSAVSSTEKAATAPTESASAPTEPPPPSVPTGSFAGNDGLAKLLSDPALLAKLPQILATVKPLLSSLSLPTSATPSKEEQHRSLPACRDNLLLALKPFLSPERCQAIDSMLRIAKLGEILGQIK